MVQAHDSWGIRLRSSGLVPLPNEPYCQAKDDNFERGFQEWSVHPHPTGIGSRQVRNPRK